MKAKEFIIEGWSQKYKKSINCSHPKGFSQKAHCAGKSKHNESVETEMVCEDCGMCQTHGNLNEIKKGAKDSNGFTKCWPGKHAAGTKKGKNGGQVRNCVPNEGVAEGLFGIDDKIKGRIQNVVSDLSDIPGMWDHKAQTFTDAGMEKLKSVLKNNPKYIKYALNLDYRDYEAEGVAEGKEDKIAQLKKDHETAVHWSKNETSPQKREAARQKAEKIKRHLDTQYKQGVAEGAPIVVVQAPIDVRNPKKASQPYRNQGDIVPDTKPPSTEKRGVKGRLGQRPMPKYDEGMAEAAKTAKKESVDLLTPDQQFDMIEEMVEQLAEAHGVDADIIWEDFDCVGDDELLETAAWRRSAGKSKKGGLNAKGVASYRRENPGSKLQTAVTTKPSKLKAGSKAAKRRKSFCARMGGVKGPMKKPNGKPTRKALALRKWNC